HYVDVGGRSPINDQCRALIEAIRADLLEHGIELPVYWGNRNWDPYLADTLQVMARDGIRRAAVFVTSAYASYSGCRQYRENLYHAASAVSAGTAIATPTPRLDKLRHYYNHPGFVQAFADTTSDAIDRLPAEERDNARLVFVTHSIPLRMAVSAGPRGGAYVRQHESVASLVGEEVSRRRGMVYEWDLVYCSRSGPPQVPWLEPDVNERLRSLSAASVEAAVVIPIGFVSDHMEVVYDLDTEAAATCEELGMTYQRAAAPGVHPAFVGSVRELLLERAAAERGESVARAALGALGPSWDVCAAGCCPNPQGSRPALCQDVPHEESA
ncbi:MAG: ferrochelatase, partial [Propionibacteriales bacterium]|nr:ferrochelatase [Propionibacteriales bacterium]